MRDLRKVFERNNATALLLFFFRLQCIYIRVQQISGMITAFRGARQPLIIVNEKIYLAYYKSKIFALH